MLIYNTITKHSMIVTYKCNLKNVAVEFVIWKELSARELRLKQLQALLEVEIEC